MSEFVIFDTEYTSWEGAHPDWGGAGQFRELIQIGAIKLTRGAGWEEAPVFDVTVKPVLNPRLSDFITQLTGITQAQVDEGLGTAEALKSFDTFIGDAAVGSNGKDIHVIAETCGLQGVKMPFAPRRLGSFHHPLYAALEKELGAPVSRKEYPSGRVYELLDLKLPTTQVHNALHDVYSLAAACTELEKRGHKVLPWPKS